MPSHHPAIGYKKFRNKKFHVHVHAGEDFEAALVRKLLEFPYLTQPA
jgi:hypothetical protein